MNLKPFGTFFHIPNIVCVYIEWRTTLCVLIHFIIIHWIKSEDAVYECGMSKKISLKIFITEMEKFSKWKDPTYPFFAKISTKTHTENQFEMHTRCHRLRPTSCESKLLYSNQWHSRSYRTLRRTRICQKFTQRARARLRTFFLFSVAFVFVHCRFFYIQSTNHIYRKFQLKRHNRCRCVITEWKVIEVDLIRSRI